MSFVRECIQDSLPVWQRCLETDFLRGIAAGTLEEECFKGYIVDDSLYLREYAKVFAWGILHARDMEEIRTYYSLLSFVSESEDFTRQFYLNHYKLRDEAIQKLPLRAQNQAYVDEMLNAARTGCGSAECMMAALPCMLSYGWIFREILRRSPEVQNTVYGRFVCDYADDSYDKLCDEWIAFAEKACAGLNAGGRQRCMKIFRACSEHELHFWEMSALPRPDLR